MRPTISLGNEKTGKIPSFSLPSIQTCPGSTETCRRVCYAAKLERIYPSVKKSYARNLEASADNMQFIANMVTGIRKACKKTGSKVFRIHVSGDFYSFDYISAWDCIIKSIPEVMFFAYTRSWRIETLKTALDVLKTNKNLVLLASVDADTSAAPAGYRPAVMGPIETTSRTIGCPEQFNPDKIKTCLDCGLCFNPKTNIGIEFKLH